MARLRSRLEDAFGDWRSQLPAAWRPHLSQVELDFEGVPLGPKLAANEQIWPMRGNSGAPRRADVFRALRDVGPDEVRVVIFGNDPYTRVAQATGRSFDQGDVGGWKRDARQPRKISPSLASILCSAISTIDDDLAEVYQLLDHRPRYRALDDWDRAQDWYAHVGLSRLIEDGEMPLRSPSQLFKYWARQGVLWLNRTLTFTKWEDEHRASHTALWAPFTARMLEVLASAPKRRSGPVVAALWGGKAKPLGEEMVDAGRRLGIPKKSLRIVEAGHPQLPSGFFRRGNPLAQINAALGSNPIDWS